MTFSSLSWWHTHVIPALGRLKQEDHEFKASLSYSEACLKVPSVTSVC